MLITQQHGIKQVGLLKAVAITALTFGLTMATQVDVAQAVNIKVLTDNLDNPRGLSVGPDGAIYVTESGVGGPVSSQCVPSPSVAGADLCYGPTGAITKIQNGVQQRIITGLPSVALPDSQMEASGPVDIEFDAMGNAYLLIAYAGNPNLRDSTLNIPEFARLHQIDLTSGALTSIADLGQYELDNNPANDDIISNPFSFLINGNRAFIIDSGANALQTVDLDGSNLSNLGIFESRVINDPIFPFPGGPSTFEMQSVPTGITIGPDGLLYVAEFTGFPYPEGGARIYRVAADGQKTVYADGFTQIVDLTFDSSGNLYILEHATASVWKNQPEGSLIGVAPDGNRETLLDGSVLMFPTALEFGPDKSLYITNKALFPDIGEVLQVDLKVVPEPSILSSLISIGIWGIACHLTLNRKVKK